MSLIADESTEISNSNQNKFTVILFSTNRNLNRTELKKTFAVKNGKLFKARNRHSIATDLFDRLFAVRASSPADGLFFNYESKNSVSHIYVVAQGTSIKDFAILKYGEELLGGFDVFKSELDDVQDLLEEYRATASFCTRGKNALNSLHQQAEMMTDSHLVTSSKLKEFLSKSVQELEGITYPIISLAKDKVDSWYDKHFWKDVSLSSEAVCDKPIQLATLRDVS